jgi:hypothetical protein
MNNISDFQNGNKNREQQKKAKRNEKARGGGEWEETKLPSSPGSHLLGRGRSLTRNGNTFTGRREKSSL